MTRLSWQIEVESNGFDKVLLTRDRIAQDVNDATTQVFNSVVDGFDLSDGAAHGLQERIAGLNAIFRDSTELKQDGIQLPLGQLVIGKIINIDGKNDLMLPPKLPSTIFLTADSFREEIKNLHDAATEFSQETAKDSSATAVEEGIAVFAEDHDLIVTEAIKLAISRRLLKYGVLPSGILTPDMASRLGFDDWFERIIIPQSHSSDMPKTVRRRLYEASQIKYESSNMAAKNIRKTIWPKIFSNFLPFNPELNQIFFAYYLNKVVQNSQNTIVFSDELTIRLPDDTVKEALEQIYAPSTFKLRPV